ncbi:MAG: AbrB/MazE/SpoVT family DNA-binding domain-containing protein [Gammaproteobacteria bacterium]
MPRVSSKRQITLPIEQCRELGIQPGDEYECYVADGRMTIVKKHSGAAKGMLKEIVVDPAISDEESLRDGISKENMA